MLNAVILIALAAAAWILFALGLAMFVARLIRWSPESPLEVDAFVAQVHDEVYWQRRQVPPGSLTHEQKSRVIRAGYDRDARLSEEEAAALQSLAEFGEPPAGVLRPREWGWQS